MSHTHAHTRSGCLNRASTYTLTAYVRSGVERCTEYLVEISPEKCIYDVDLN